MSATMAQRSDDVPEGQRPAEELASEEAASESTPSLNGAHGHGDLGSADAPAMPGIQELSGILEALLFMVPDPLPINRLVALMGSVTKHEVEQALERLRDEYSQEGRGLHLAEVAGGYRIVTKSEYAPWVKRLEKVKAPAKLSRSALESLAIIAYKQPIVRAEIEQIRGVETSGVLRTLLERKLVRIVGRKEEPGRPIMYGTTKFFLEHFGLRDLAQLPPLREFKELGESEQAMLPIGEDQDAESEGSSPDGEAMEGDADEFDSLTENAEQTESLMAESGHRA